jgi:hypothetical protein
MIRVDWMRDVELGLVRPQKSRRWTESRRWTATFRAAALPSGIEPV